MSSDTHSKAALTAGPDLIRRAQSGDSDAFAVLFNAHKRRVYSLCLHMTRNAAEAEELAQDAFLQVFRKISTFRGDSAFSTWLHRIAVNTVLMYFRRKSPCQISLDELYSQGNEAYGAIGDVGPMGRPYEARDLRLEASVMRVALSRAIGALPDGYRSVFVLHEVEGYGHHEIAEMLGCSSGTSKSQLHRARLRVRELLTGSPKHTEFGRDAGPSTVISRAQSAHEEIDFLRNSRQAV